MLSVSDANVGNTQHLVAHSPNTFIQAIFNSFFIFILDIFIGL